jgi:N-acetyl-anhydromuramyl-L-alanine amidase AmpD
VTVGRDGLSRRGLLLGALAAAGGGMLLGSGQAWAADSPAIIDCAGWGARANSDIVPIWNQRPIRILVHHTATPNVADVSQDAAVQLARAIQNFHMDARGWLDTGQHFTISRGGFVMEGRHRSLEVLRIGRQQVEGAHCTGQNVAAVGIENEGIYTDVTPPAALWTRLRDLCAYICQQYAIAPTEIYGHRDYKDTLCPGDRLYGMLPQLRSEVATALGRRVEGGPTQQTAGPLLRLGDSGPDVRTAQGLLRAAGLPGVPVDGRFDARTDAAVRAFQLAHGTEEVNGLIGGETWPLLLAVTH